MQIVGDHLKSIAESEKDKVVFDLFGRSAFNRYYYSAFLSARESLSLIDSKWSILKHKELPITLRKEVQSRAITEIKKQEKSRILDANESAKMKHDIRVALADLSRILENARLVRTIADYEPNVLIENDKQTITLSHCTITSAANWRRSVESNFKTVLAIYGKIGLI